MIYKLFSQETNRTECRMKDNRKVMDRIIRFRVTYGEIRQKNCYPFLQFLTAGNRDTGRFYRKPV